MGSGAPPLSFGSSVASALASPRGITAAQCGALLAQASSSEQVGRTLDALRLGLGPGLPGFTPGDFSRTPFEVAERVRHEALEDLPKLAGQPTTLRDRVEQWLTLLGQGQQQLDTATQEGAHDIFLGLPQPLKPVAALEPEWKQLTDTRTSLAGRARELAKGHLAPAGSESEGDVQGALAKLEATLRGPGRQVLVEALVQDKDLLLAAMLDPGLREEHHWALASAALAPVLPREIGFEDSPVWKAALARFAGGALLETAARDEPQEVAAVYRVARPMLEAWALQQADVYGTSRVRAEPASVHTLDQRLRFTLADDLLAQTSAEALTLTAKTSAPEARRSTSEYDDDRAQVRGEWVKDFDQAAVDLWASGFDRVLYGMPTVDRKRYDALLDAVAGSRELMVVALLDPQFQRPESWRWVDQTVAPHFAALGYDVSSPEVFSGLLRLSASALMSHAFRERPAFREMVAQLWPTLEARVAEDVRTATPYTPSSQQAGLRCSRLAVWEHQLQVYSPQQREEFYARVGIPEDDRERYREGRVTG